MTTNACTASMRVFRTKLRAAMDQLKECTFNTCLSGGLEFPARIHTSEVTRDRKIQSFSYKGLEGQVISADVISEGIKHGQRHAR